MFWLDVCFQAVITEHKDTSTAHSKHQCFSRHLSACHFWTSLLTFSPIFYLLQFLKQIWKSFLQIIMQDKVRDTKPWPLLVVWHKINILICLGLTETRLPCKVITDHFDIYWGVYCNSVIFWTPRVLHVEVYHCTLHIKRAHLQ